VYLKLTGDKISLFDIRRGAREAKPSVEIDLETLLQVDEDVSPHELCVLSFGNRFGELDDTCYA
jgi:hypothetical protein